VLLRSRFSLPQQRRWKILLLVPLHQQQRGWNLTIARAKIMVFEESANTDREERR